ncbi:pisatin demethylase [Cladophialophora carrionii]|uniref:Pisatin demethylase n=1 Tax=Cladophialophora carrionii TaxID=86049 RepID=A0A1C1CV54_9EURO|nr:pisatin demethylase [Cladophialophora carrionii]
MTAPRSPFRRGHWYKAMKLDPRINNLLSEQDERRHAELRAKMMPGYTAKEVPDLEATINDRLLDLIALITREGIEKRLPIDFATFAQYFTLDSLTHIAFGRPFGFLTHNEDLYNYNKTSTAFFPVLELGTNFPWVHAILSSPLLQALAGPKPEDKAGLGAIIGIAQEIVAERFHSGSESKNEKDMLNSFIRHGLTQLEAESESLLQILAGSDSTATTIRMTLLFILTNPAVYVKLRTEIDAAVADGQITFPVVKYSEAQRLPYLQACIKEGLRVWQPLNGIGTKLSPPEEIEICGVRIPPHTQVAISQHMMMKRRDLFGDDAAIFRPERWVENDPETLKRMERVWELSFAAGRFTCLGKGIALMELNKVFVELLRRFDLGIVNPVKTMETKCHQIHVQRNMFLHVTARAM